MFQFKIKRKQKLIWEGGKKGWMKGWMKGWREGGRGTKEGGREGRKRERTRKEKKERKRERLNTIILSIIFAQFFIIITVWFQLLFSIGSQVQYMGRISRRLRQKGRSLMDHKQS